MPVVGYCSSRQSCYYHISINIIYNSFNKSTFFFLSKSHDSQLKCIAYSIGTFEAETFTVTINYRKK